MIGLKRLANLRMCVETILEDGIPGDLIETGVWRGGATIFMRAILKAHGVTNRSVWVADSFAGLPPPDTKRYPPDAGITLHQFPQLAVFVGTRTRQLPAVWVARRSSAVSQGLVSRHAAGSPIERLAILRLDGDLYESTILALDGLYGKLSAGGFVIVDDYNNVAACRQAVDDFRTEHGIRDAIQPIDWGGVFWRRSADQGQPNGSRDAAIVEL